jgi:hypothetical protein
MKTLLSILIISVATFAWAGESTAATPPTSSVVKGEVLEVKDVESYIYLRLKTKEGEIWAAVGKAPVSKGAKVTIEDVTVMHNFESKSLNKTFPTIAFGNLAGAKAPGRGDGMALAHAGNAKATDLGDFPVPKASGTNAYTVAEISTKAAELKDKTVLVAGRIVKYNPAIMGKNWIHLRDGSGSAADGTNDLLVTSMSEAKVGDVVTVNGMVRTDKDFGSGYAYKVLIEEATLR